VNHGGVNATLVDRDKVESLTLDEAVQLLDAKAGRVSLDQPVKTPLRPRSTRAPSPGAAIERNAAPKTRSTTKRASAVQTKSAATRKRVKPSTRPAAKPSGSARAKSVKLKARRTPRT
jgi:hypothetical protein